MKNISISIILLFAMVNLLPNKSMAQSGWFWQTPLPQHHTLNDIYVFNESTCIAVGDSGTIIKTTNKGTSWAMLPSGTNSNLYSVYFINSNTGWVVGRGSTILKTTNGGTSWISQAMQSYDPFYSVFFINSSTGWISGEDNTILKTTNGGTNWVFQPGILPKSIKSIYFTDLNNGCAAGIDYNGSSYFGKIVRTTNGGANWTTQWSGAWLLSIYFTNSNTGWAAGFGVILKTTDGGVNWIPQITGTNYGLYSIYFSDSNTGWAAGVDGNPYPGIILKTTDGGMNWNPTIVTSANTDLYSVHFADSTNGWCVGYEGAILHTINGGVTFVDEENNEIPKEFLLSQNYPNPFNPTTTISWQSPVSGRQVLKVFDALGNEVATLVDEYKQAGSYEVEFDGHSDEGQNISSGVYFYRLRSGSFVETKKMIFLK